MEKLDVQQRLKNNGGFCTIDNFLPTKVGFDFVAERPYIGSYIDH